MDDKQEIKIEGKQQWQNKKKLENAFHFIKWPSIST